MKKIKFSEIVFTKTNPRSGSVKSSVGILYNG